MTANRLIPARAGNTGGVFAWSRATAAHPRSRGEHRSVSVPMVKIHGSSPLARGTHTAENTDDAGVRLIPARAGNTCIGGAGF